MRAATAALITRDLSSSMLMVEKALRMLRFNYLFIFSFLFKYINHINEYKNIKNLNMEKKKEEIPVPTQQEPPIPPATDKQVEETKI